MATEIRVWQIVEGKLEALDDTLVSAGRKETEHLETWLMTNPDLLGGNIVVIGHQVQTKSGPMDLLGIDSSGNIVIVELKRDRLPREALVQAMDYASDAATWDAGRLGEICQKYRGKDLDEVLSDAFGDLFSEEFQVNSGQRILLVGFAIEEPLQRMIEWLSDTYSVSVNAVVLRYIRTQRGEELLAQTTIIPEEVEKQRGEKKKIKIEVSDEPGQHEVSELRELLRKFLRKNEPAARRIRELLMPLCLKHEVVTRDMIKEELQRMGEASGERYAGILVASISNLMHAKKRDYLRQVISYEKPRPWEKDNYRLRPEYRDLVRELLAEAGGNELPHRSSEPT